MPIKSSTLNKTPFSQSRLLDFLTTDESASFKENIVKTSNSKERFTGFCFGASVNFLHYSNKGLEQEYINVYNKYLDDIKTNNAILQKKRSDLNIQLISHYKDYIERKEITKQGNKLLKEIVDMQKLAYKSVLNYNLSKSIPLSSPIFEEKNFIKLIDLALDKNFNELKDEKNRMKTTVLEKILHTNKQYIKTKYVSEINKIKERNFPHLNSESDTNYKHWVINHLLNLARISTCKEIDNAWIEINNQKDLNTNIAIINSMIEPVKLNDFMNMINNCKDEIQNYTFSSRTHACAINIKRYKESEKYEFFDPNEGIYEFDNFKDFSFFLKDYMDKNKIHKFIKDEDSDYRVSFIKLNGINQSSASCNEKSFDSNLKINKLLALDNFEVIFKRTSLKNILLNNKNDSIIYQSFNKKNHLVTLEFNYTKSNRLKQKTLYSSNIDASNLHQIIQDNLTRLKQTDQDIFIDKIGNIYPIAPNISMADFTLKIVPSDKFGSTTLNKK